MRSKFIYFVSSSQLIIVQFHVASYCYTHINNSNNNNNMIDLFTQFCLYINKYEWIEARTITEKHLDYAQT